MQQSLDNVLHSRKAAALLHYEGKRSWVSQRSVTLGSHFCFCIPFRRTFCRHFQFGQFSGLMKMHPGRGDIKRKLVPASSVVLLLQQQTTKIPVFFVDFLFNQPWACFLYARFFFPPAVISFHISDSFCFPPVARLFRLPLLLLLLLSLGRARHVIVGASLRLPALKL